MEFGTWITNDPQCIAEEAKFAEEHGFSHGWVGDLPLDFGDVFVCLTLAATATRTLKLGSWIVVAPYRIPPASVNAIATIHTLAPGRLILGVGTGSYGRAVMGLPAMKIAMFRQWLVTVRDLLRTGEAMQETEGLRRKIRFFNRDRQFISLDPPIPLYIAASAPRVAALAGEFGDGVFNAGPLSPEAVSAFLRQVRTGAEKVGRQFTRVPCIWETPVCVLRPGETIHSPRVMESTGHFVLMVLRIYAAGGIPDEVIPPEVRPSFQAYAAAMTQRSVSPEEQHLRLWEGHHFLRPEDRQFITVEAIRWCTLVGRREELIDRLKALEEAGLTQIAVSPPLDGVRAAVQEISRELIGRV